MDPVLLTIFLGLLNTILVHTAKAMQKHGIDFYDQLKKHELHRKTSLVYLFGLFLNQTPMIWGTLAGKWGNASYYTSMFPLGLIILVLYSKKVIHEPLSKKELSGIGCLIIGIFSISMENLRRPTYSAAILVNRAFYIIGAVIMVFAFLSVWSFRKKQSSFITIVFGLFSGTLGGLDPVLKNIGLQYQISDRFFPASVMGWTIYLISFLGGLFAIITTQIGFAAGARANQLVPLSSMSFVLFPLLIYIFTLPGFTIGYLTTIGLVFTAIGLIFISSNLHFNLKKPIEEKICKV